MWDEAGGGGKGVGFMMDCSVYSLEEDLCKQLSLAQTMQHFIRY